MVVILYFKSSMIVKKYIYKYLTSAHKVYAFGKYPVKLLTYQNIGEELKKIIHHEIIIPVSNAIAGEYAAKAMHIS